MSVPSLSRHHARVLAEVFAHPLPRNLEWNDVVSLIENLGSVVDRHDGKYDFRIGTASAVFRRPHGKDIDVAQVEELRTFLAQAGIGPKSSTGTIGAPIDYTAVLIDHHSARFFEPVPGQKHVVERDHIEPYDPHGFRRHLEHREDLDLAGEREPESTEYYERIAQRLKGARTVVLLGDATGTSSALNFFRQYLEKRHKDVYAHVAGTAQVDISSADLADIEHIAERYARS
jgi:hypothetical protein